MEGNAQADREMKITADEVIAKFKDDGDFDTLRLKIIRKLKENAIGGAGLDFFPNPFQSKAKSISPSFYPKLSSPNKHLSRAGTDRNWNHSASSTADGAFHLNPTDYVMLRR